MKSVKRKNNRKTNKRKMNPQAGILILFVVSMVFYVGTKLGLNSYNITLQKQAQDLQAEVTAKQEEVNQLETEINSLQNKTRLLGMLDDSVRDNQNNIYIIDVQ